MYFDESADQAKEIGHKAIANFFVTVMNHYELLGDHFPKVYQIYAEQSAALQSIGKERACVDYVSLQSCGTPEAIAERLKARQDLMGDYELNVCARFGGWTVQ